MFNPRRLIIAALLVGGGAACDRSAPDNRQEALEAQQEANREIAQTQQKAAEESAEIRKDVTEKATEVRKDYGETVTDATKKLAETQENARAKVAEVQADANKEIREANSDVIAADQDLHKWGQGKIDALNNRIDDATVKAQSAKPTARAAFAQGMTEIKTTRDELATDLASATARGVVPVEKTKDGFDTRIDKLEERIDRLSKQLTKKD